MKDSNDVPSEKALRIFEEAKEIRTTVARAAFLKKACGRNKSLLASVKTLLENCTERDVFQQFGRSIGEQVGDTIDKYKLLRVIGEGGFGVVYLAEQQEPLTRQVALKVIRSRMANEQVLQMFKAECQMLASLNHCNIAKVFDSGETEDGRPYFVLEFVDGSHITDYCDGHEMTIANRIKLLIKVCRTIHEAHLKGVIHRDLKPSNILVIKESGDSLPKVIDFGIAKAMGTQGSPGSRAAKSATGPIGTLNYMSPEQAGFDDVDVDRLTDVYSLGIVAYELLVGYLPLSGEEVTLSSLLASFGTGQRLSPSAKWNTLGERKMLNVAHRRNCTPSSLGVAIDELDAIVMKCLEVNRSKRYETADSLANDLQDYLRSRERLPRPFLYGIAGIVVYGIAGIVVLAAIVWSFVRHPLGQTDSVSPHQTEALPIDAPQPLVNSDLDTAHNVINRAIGNLDNR